MRQLPVPTDGNISQLTMPLYNELFSILFHGANAYIIYYIESEI